MKRERDDDLERRIRGAISAWYAYGLKIMTSPENIRDIENDRAAALAYIDDAFEGRLN